jgi:hypothetical protein
VVNQELRVGFTECILHASLFPISFWIQGTADAELQLQPHRVWNQLALTVRPPGCQFVIHAKADPVENFAIAVPSELALPADTFRS